MWCVWPKPEKRKRTKERGIIDIRQSIRQMLDGHSVVGSNHHSFTAVNIRYMRVFCQICTKQLITGIFYFQIFLSRL